jgi:uncharacterized SAM-binding protein YcdF (DUF218 family)
MAGARPPPGAPTDARVGGWSFSCLAWYGLSLIIATGGANRHNGIIEGCEFACQLTQAAVPRRAIRVEDQSKDTWQNVGLSLPHLREALALGLRLTVVSKWYHLRAVHCLATLLPQSAPFHAISWEPVYAGTLVTRANWPKSQTAADA